MLRVTNWSRFSDAARFLLLLCLNVEVGIAGRHGLLHVPGHLKLH